MPTIILTDCRVAIGGYDLSGIHHSLNLEFGAEMLDDTVFGTSGTRSNRPGLQTVSFTGNGFWDTLFDKPLYDRIGATREVMSASATGVENDIGYTFRGVNGKYNPLTGQVGALVPFEINGMAANTPLVKGRILAVGSKAVTGSGTGTLIQAIGALPQKGYSGFHVTGGAGTAALVVESSATGAGGWTVRATHPGIVLVAGIGAADWQEVAGPVTDTFWRATWTITGGPATIFHVFGIR
jgi:hypothetical protein